MKKRLNLLPAIIKATKVIDSCETVEQLRIARRYNKVVGKWMANQIRKNGGILENIDDYSFSLDVMFELTDRVINKSRELDVLI
jgi:hypothetical protein